MRRPSVNFQWAPSAGFSSFLIGTSHYPPDSSSRYQTATLPAETLVTFTASVVATPNQQIVYYNWDFGDGTKASGPQVKHSYALVQPETQVSLTVIDSNRQQFQVRKMVNIADQAHALIISDNLILHSSPQDLLLTETLILDMEAPSAPTSLILTPALIPE